MQGRNSTSASCQWSNRDCRANQGVLTYGAAYGAMMHLNGSVCNAAWQSALSAPVQFCMS